MEKNPGVLIPAPPLGLAELHNPTFCPWGCHRTSCRGQWAGSTPPARSLKVARSPPPLIHPCFRAVSASSFSSGIFISPKSSLLVPPTIQLFLPSYTWPALNSLSSNPSLVILECPQLPVSHAFLHSPIPGPLSRLPQTSPHFPTPAFPISSRGSPKLPPRSIFSKHLPTS